MSKEKIEEMRPAIHRRWVEEGKMTMEESNKLVEEWIRNDQYYGMTDAELLGAYQDEDGEWQV